MLVSSVLIKHKKMCLLGGIFFSLGLSACQTTSPIDAPTSETKAQPTTKPTVAQNTEEESPLADEDSLGDGFCIDDIYATYLQKSFAENRAPTPKTDSRIKKRKQSKNAETEAEFHARKILSGPVEPYFGAIPVVSNKHVDQWVSYFKDRGRPTFIKWLVRAEAFRDVVAPVLFQEGLPQELFYLAMIESGFSNTAASSAKATGTWQFMKSTAQLYNLRINHWVDERRDPVRSTVAAARYLRDLYAEFGDWYLAMAAYNAGPGKVRRAIRETGSRDFWRIIETRYLKAETKNYVPKMLAALNLSINARAHGFDVGKDQQHILPISTVKLESPISIAELSKLFGLPSDTIRRWNPEIIRDITPPSRNEPYALRLSNELVSRYTEISSKLSKIEVTDVLMHKIKVGETLSAIARRYKVPMIKIKEFNPSLNPKALRIGNQIAVPIPGVVTKQPIALLPSKEFG